MTEQGIFLLTATGSIDQSIDRSSIDRSMDQSVDHLISRLINRGKDAKTSTSKDARISKPKTGKLNEWKKRNKHKTKDAEEEEDLATRNKSNRKI